MLTFRASRSPRYLVVALLAASACAVAGCGTSDTQAAEISGDTFCSDYLAQPVGHRSAAAGRVAAEVGVTSPMNPDWVTALEGRCREAPDLKLHDFFAHFR